MIVHQRDDGTFVDENDNPVEIRDVNGELENPSPPPLFTPRRPRPEQIVNIRTRTNSQGELEARRSGGTPFTKTSRASRKTQSKKKGPTPKKGSIREQKVNR